MRYCGRKVFLALAVSMGISLLQAASSPVLGDPQEKKAETRVTMWIDFFELGIQDTVRLFGPVKLNWLDPFPSPEFPPHFEIPAWIDTVRWWNRSGVWGREVPGIPIEGRGFLLEPEPWVESFFDVTFEIEIPKRLPKDTLSLFAPVRAFGRSHDWPPYFDKFETPPGMPPVPLHRRDGSVAAHLMSFEMEMIPHYEPGVRLSVETAYGSNVAVVGENGTIGMSAGLSGDYEAVEAVFSYRPCGAPGPFTPFHVDADGSARVLSTHRPVGTGDGWSAYFDPGTEPFEGQCVQFEAALFVPPYGVFRDTVEVFVDPTPPIPSFFDIARDSIAHYHIDSFFDVTYKLDDELMAPGISEVWVFPLQTDFQRDLAVIDQLGLGTDMDSMSCGPTAGASCLKYFAGHGYPGLDHVGGDESKPEQSGEDIARELQGAMGTNAAEGTTADGMVAGIGSYLKSRGQNGWAVEHHPVDDATDLAEMFREFQSDSEDVIVLLEDTTAAGDTMGHAVTLGSTHTSYPGEGSSASPEMRMDFMDPWEGGSTADNDYPLDASGGGRPSTEGYDLNGEGGDAKVAGYVKVSPPEGPAPPPGLARSSLEAAARAPWMLVASGPVRGHGLVDTLRWDTSPFPAGMYLVEIVTVDDQGFRCRDIRLAGIASTTTGHDLPDHGGRSMLRGSYPNPFNPATTIEYYLAAGAKVTLAIYDAAGRRVRTLVAGKPVAAGLHKVDWDGRNDMGRRLASGVYFANFVAEGQVSAKKLILLK